MGCLVINSAIRSALLLLFILLSNSLFAQTGNYYEGKMVVSGSSEPFLVGAAAHVQYATLRTNTSSGGRQFSQLFIVNGVEVPESCTASFTSRTTIRIECDEIWIQLRGDLNRLLCLRNWKLEPCFQTGVGARRYENARLKPKYKSSQTPQIFPNYRGQLDPSSQAATTTILNR